MARIRSIKPDAPQHRKVGPLSDRGFRVWVCCITQADDQGRFVCDASQVRVWAFAYHPTVTVEDTEAAILEVAGTGLIRLYQVNGTRYGYFPSWGDHQKINRPNPSRLPAPPPFDEDTLNTHGALTECSLSSTPRIGVGVGDGGGGAEGVAFGSPGGGSERPSDGASEPERRSEPEAVGRGSGGPGSEASGHSEAGSRRPARAEAAPEGFAAFWTAYPRKVAKQAALRAWAKLAPADGLLDRIMGTLEVQKQSDQWQRDSGAYIPYPASWLNGRRWEDEPAGNSDGHADPYADWPHGWECHACGELHEGTKAQVGSCLKDAAR